MIFFRITLDLSYIYYVFPYFEYTGFTLSQDPGRYATSWLLFAISLIGITGSISKPSDLFKQIAICKVLVPLTSLSGLSSISFYPLIISILAVHSIFAVASSNLTPVPHIGKFRDGTKIALSIAIILITIVGINLILSGGMNYFNLDISLVYEFRRDSQAVTSNGIFAYLNPWAFKVFTPFLLAIGILQRNFVYVLISIAATIFFFGISAQKSVLFTPLMILGVWFVLRKTNRDFIIPLGLGALVLGSLILGLTTDNFIFSSLFSRRLFFVPASLTGAYFDFFAFNPKVFWSNGILGNFMSYPYGSFQVPELIGEYLYTENYANNGFVSSGFSQAGLVGIMLYSVILGVIIKFTNSLQFGLNQIWFSSSVVAVPIYAAISSSDLITSLSTHGLAIALIMLIISRS